MDVVRWRSYGKDRLYVNGPGGERLGWCDLLTGAISVEDEQHRAAVDAAIHTWRATQKAEAESAAGAPALSTAGTTPAGRPVPPTTQSAEVVPGHAQPDPGPATRGTAVGVAGSDDEWEDLSGRRAGQQAREQAVALRQAAPVRTFLARVLGVHTDERAWRIGADGEEMVAAQLAKLVRRNPAWRVLHAVPVGENDADIDHVVIGPPGVFTLNTKHHPGAKIWVAGYMFKVNGQNQPYLRKSQHEAQRAARLLAAASGTTINAIGVVVPVGAADVVIKAAPDGVHVVTRRRLVSWLESQAVVLDHQSVETIYAAAKQSTTWQTKR